MTASRRFIRYLGVWPTRRPYAALAVALILAVLSLAGISRLRAASPIASLLDPNDPSASAMLTVMQRFDGVDQLLIMATAPAGHSRSLNADTLLAYAHRLQAALTSSPTAAPLVRSIEYRPSSQWKSFFENIVAPAALFYLDDANFQAAKDRLSLKGMTNQIRRDQAMLAAPGPAADALSAALLKDPLRLHEFLLASFPSTGKLGFSTAQQGYFSPDGRSILIRIGGVKPAGDAAFASHLTAAADQVAHQVNTDHLELDITGAYAIAAASERAIRHDMIASVIGSVICLQLLFILAYRRPLRTFLLAFFPVAAGILYGFGIYSLFFTSIAPTTAVLGAVLAGLGIDYSVLYLSRYYIERAAGDSSSAATSTSLAVAPALLGACVTSIIGFAAIGGSHVPALRDFALVGSLGLGACLATALWVLPAMLSARRRTSAPLPARISTRPLVAMIARHPWPCIVASVLLFSAAVAVMFSAKVMLPSETDMTVMHPRPNAALEAQAKVADRFGIDPGSLMVLLHAPTPDDLVILAHEVRSRMLSPALRHAGISATLGLASLLPDPRIVPARRAAITPEQVHTIIDDFHKAISQSAFNADAYELYVRFLQALLAPSHVPSIADLARYPALSQLMLSNPAKSAASQSQKDSAVPLAMTLLTLDRSLADLPQRQAAISAVRHALHGLAGATLTGLSVIQLDSQNTIARDVPWLLLWAGGLSTLYLLLHFGILEVDHRRQNGAAPSSNLGIPPFIVAAVLALVPAVFSLACRLAFIHIADQKLNPMNLIAIPLLIGIDIDYGIFLVSLARHARREGTNIVDGIAVSCHAICISALSTILGFGSLVTTHVPAIRSLGWAMAVGVATCLFGALFLLAPILILMGARSSRAPAAQRCAARRA